MPPSLTAHVYECLDSVTPAEWAALYPGHPDSYEMVLLVQSCGLDGFTFRSIVVRDQLDDSPVLMLPLFDTQFSLKDLLEGPAAKAVGRLGNVFGRALRPRVLGVGFVEGEWGAVGVRPGLDAATRRAAWDEALTALRALSDAIHAKVVLWLNFTPATAALLPPGPLGRFAAIDTFPCARLPLPFRDVDDYLAGLSKLARKDLRRKLRAAAAVRVERTRDPGPWLGRIHSLYLSTVARAAMSLGAHRAAYFARVCDEVPGAEFVLYFHGDELLAFNLLVRRDGQLIDKYFCADEARGRELSLYFVSWVENVRYCLGNDIPVYHAGPGAEATKARLGARFTASVTLFRHANPVVHWALSRLRPLLAYKPAVQVPPVQIGTGWDELDGRGAAGSPLPLARPVVAADRRELAGGAGVR